jgi:hypothetical protein
VSVTISPQVRVLALVGLLAALGLGASMLVLNRGGSSSEAASSTPATSAPRTHTASASPPAAKPHVPARHATKPVNRPATKPVTKPVTKPTTRPHATTRHHVHKATKPAGFKGNPVYAQLPQALQWQLAHHKIVVVSLYNPGSDVDAISVAEAHAGAVEAGAGFLLVSVLDNKVAGILTALLPNGGLLPDPGVLVDRAPGEVALRLDGFADRASVAQAATNAAAGETGPAPSAALASTPVAAVPAPVAPTTTTP